MDSNKVKNYYLIPTWFNDNHNIHLGDQLKNALNFIETQDLNCMYISVALDINNFNKTLTLQELTDFIVFTNKRDLVLFKLKFPSYPIISIKNKKIISKLYSYFKKYDHKKGVPYKVINNNGKKFNVYSFNDENYFPIISDAFLENGMLS